MVRTHHRPKLTRYADLICLIVKTVNYLEHDAPTTANEIVDTGDDLAAVAGSKALPSWSRAPAR